MASRARALMVHKGFKSFAGCATSFACPKSTSLSRPVNPLDDPTWLYFVRVVDGVADFQHPLMVGCIHPLEEVCHMCDIPDGDHFVRPEDETQDQKKLRAMRVKAKCFKKIWWIDSYVRGVRALP